MLEPIELGALIRELRMAKNITAKEVAEKCGVSQSTITNIENGKSFPSVATMELICDAIGIRLSDFFLLIEERRKLKQISQYALQSSFVLNRLPQSLQRSFLKLAKDVDQAVNGDGDDA